MDLSNTILIKKEARLTPPVIDMLDLETQENPIRTPDRTGYSKNLGRTYPLVKIGNVRIPASDLVSVSLFYDEFLPKIHISIIDPMGTLTSVNFPKTNPLITVYIAPSHPKLVSLCQTFLISDFHSIPIRLNLTRYDFFGELYVPKLNSNFVKSYNKMTSQDALLKIAEELGLGYASNEESFNDSMTWINPNLNYSNFIKNIADHTYKNETSFFECFIDRRYNLTLVNVDTQLKPYDRKEKPEMGYSSVSTDYLDLSKSKNGNKTVADDLQTPIILSNGPINPPNSEFTITEFSLVGENGSVLKREGFKKKVQFYQHGEASPVKDWFVEPLSKPSNDGELTYPKPELTDYTQNYVVKWMGTDYGNSHANYKFAKLINSHNREDISRTELKVKLVGMNNNVARGSRVIVKIYSDQIKKVGLENAKDELDAKSTASDLEDKATAKGSLMYEDEYLSGAYYVKSITYHYNSQADVRNSRFSTTMILTRREWLPEPKMELKK